MKDRILALSGPMSLLMVLFVWLLLMMLGFALMLWPVIEASFAQALLESGSSLFTLGFAATHGFGTTALHFSASATGLIVVALQIAYLPTLYAAFNLGRRL